MTRHMMLRIGLVFRLVIPATIIVAGCVAKTEPEVIVYCAVDKEFSEPILQQFERETGIKVRAKFDLESNKTVGLANAILQQKSRPQCDLFWNNEIMHTLRLKQEELLQPYHAQAAGDLPESFVSAERDWFGIAARARVFLINKELLPDESQWPRSIRDLADPKWKGRCAMARPLFGTTATHAAVLYHQWGQAEADQFFRQVAKNAVIEGGNKQVALRVSRGNIAFGLTDTDDAIIEREQNSNVAIVFLDQGGQGEGTLLIPNTLAIIRGSANPRSAERLLDYLLRPETEDALAVGRSAQIPLNRFANQTSRALPQQFKAMEINFPKAAADWEKVKNRLLTIF